MDNESLRVDKKDLSITMGDHMRASTVMPVLTALLLSWSQMAVAAKPEPVDLLPELSPLLAKDESVLAYNSADLNGDGLQDIVFIVELNRARKGNAVDDDGRRILKIAVRLRDGSLTVVKQSEKAVLCRTCGGAFGDPFEDLAASYKGFSIQHYGGSSWRWSNTYTFAYSKRDDTWQLVEVDVLSFHASAPDKQEGKTYSPPRDFGKIDIAAFDPYEFKGVGPK